MPATFLILVKTVGILLVFFNKFLPEFSRRLNYRMLDVSALKVLWNDWKQGPAFEKETIEQIRKDLPFESSYLKGGAHDAYYDIHSSLAELNYYRRSITGS